MEEEKLKMRTIWEQIDSAMCELSEAKQDLEDLEVDLFNNKSTIRDIENLKRELKRDGLYSDKLEDFLENYMKYYNK